MSKHDSKVQKATDQTDSTKERLLMVAEELFAKKGLSGTSVREIGSAVGVANSTILYYFPSKEALYKEVLKRIAKSIQTITEDITEDLGNDEKQVEIMVERLIDWTHGNPEYNQILIREIMENSERMSGERPMYLSEVIEMMKKPLERLNEKNKMQFIDPTLFLFQIIGSVSYMLIALPTIRQIIGKQDFDSWQGRQR
ncbi:HTH-type transcriptional regulator RutR [Neobacillus rhizosphaerae]|uniref:HTH-type transcriptional regulator RutR n=1 Tax=Neobacillus rhizosphaerae TaxID=2880965 RepID=A0ABM9ELV4_9BACI|nr:TetR/AcrR family transcriptional regulator [Neobacillus rhizosphaerae]CAH2713110.1 HTH-type transcriptional regulator RutR [Neobacillus rhizosphaerae]